MLMIMFSVVTSWMDDEVVVKFITGNCHLCRCDDYVLGYDVLDDEGRHTVPHW